MKSRSEHMAKQIILPPDARVAEVLTHNPYPLPNAIAELVDNSIDALAKNVLVRFVRNADCVLAIQVIDDGNGIQPSQFNKAMTFGYQNKHKLKDIGMYGVGLKTASLSQADELRVVSKVSGGIPGGRQWLRKNLNKSILDVLSPSEAFKIFEKACCSCIKFKIEKHGTIIEWGEVHDLQRSEGDADRYLKLEMQDIESHLGLVFHRLIENDAVKLHIDVVQGREVVQTKQVFPLNPFKYPKSGANGYPKNFTINIPGSSVIIKSTAHIWPPRTKLREYKIPRVGGRTNTIDSQGLYFYYNNRLVMPGGWANVRTPEAHYSLARMAIDLTDDAMKILVIGYSKDNVRIPSSFIQALKNSSSTDGSNFAKWVDTAQVIFRTPSPGGAKIPELPSPSSGVPIPVARAFEESKAPAGTNIRVVWKKLKLGHIFSIERGSNNLFINKTYKSKIIDGGISSSDAGLFKTLLILALRDHFGSRSGKKLVALESAYQKILLSAIKY